MVLYIESIAVTLKFDLCKKKKTGPKDHASTNVNETAPQTKCTGQYCAHCIDELTDKSLLHRAIYALDHSGSLIFVSSAKQTIPVVHWKYGNVPDQGHLPAYHAGGAGTPTALDLHFGAQMIDGTASSSLVHERLEWPRLTPPPPQYLVIATNTWTGQF